MENKEVISVIVPVYKVEPWLDRCVESIVKQTYQNLEIILVDDGSPDNCPAMCDAWAEKDSRIKVIHKENGGLSSARNAGMAAATGTYIGFVDSDDWIHPDFLTAMYWGIRENKAQIAACGVCLIHPGEKEPKADSTSALGVFSAEEALATVLRGETFRAVAWNKLYEKTLLKEEFFPVGKYHEDEFFTYRILAKAERLVYVNAPLYFYFQRPGSIMRSASIRHLDALDAYLERLEFLKERYPALYVRDLGTCCISCAAFYREGLRMKTEDRGEYLKRVRAVRSQVCVRPGQFMQMSAKHRIYAMGTGLAMDLFCRVLNLRKG